MIPVLTAAASGLIEVWKNSQNRKAAKEQAEAALKQAKLSGDKELTLSRDQIEAAATKGLGSSWKDEAVTVVFLSPIVLILLAPLLDWVASGFEGSLTNTVTEAVYNLDLALGGNYGVLTVAVILAAVGLRGLKR